MTSPIDQQHTYRPVHPRTEPTAKQLPVYRNRDTVHRSPRSHPVMHPLATPRDADGTPLRGIIGWSPQAAALLGERPGERGRRTAHTGRATRAQRARARRNR